MSDSALPTTKAVDALSALDSVRQPHLEGNWSQFSSFSDSSQSGSPTGEAQQTPRLHIGRIRIHGSPPTSHSPVPFPLSLYRPPTLSLPHPQPLNINTNMATRSPPSLARSNSFRTSSNPLINTYQPPEGWKAVIPIGDSYPNCVLRGLC